MTLRKEIYDSPTAAASPARRRSSVMTRLIALAIEMPPVIYVALTGSVPTWIRVWLVVWLTLWLLVVTVQAVSVQVPEDSR